MINTNQLIGIPVVNASVPSEGAKALPLFFDFTAATSQSIDLTAMQSLGQVCGIQGLFIDNSSNAVPLTVVVNQSQQTIICPAQSQGFFVVLVPNPSKFTLSCAGAATTNTPVYLLNFPVNSAVWSVVGNGATYSGGKLLVSDPVLDAAVIANQMQTLSYLIGDSGTQYPNWIGNQSVTGAISATTAALITGNPGYFLKSLQLTLSPSATLAAAGDLVISLVDSSSGTIKQFGVYVPSAAPTLTGAACIQIADSNFDWNNKTANSNLIISLSTALTAGKMYYNIGYGHTGLVN